MKTMKVMEALREAMCIRMREDQEVADRKSVV